MLQAFHAIETGLRLHLDLQGKSVLRRATKGHLNSCKQTPHIGEQKLGILKKTLSYGPIHIQTLCFKSPLGRHLS